MFFMFFKKPNKPRFFKWVSINTENWRSFDIADFIWYSVGEKIGVSDVAFEGTEKFSEITAALTQR